VSVGGGREVREAGVSHTDFRGAKQVESVGQEIVTDAGRRAKKPGQILTLATGTPEKERKRKKLGLFCICNSLRSRITDRGRLGVKKKGENKKKPNKSQPE